MIMLASLVTAAKAERDWHRRLGVEHLRHDPLGLPLPPERDSTLVFDYGDIKYTYTLTHVDYAAPERTRKRRPSR